MNPTAQKFGYPDSLVREYTHWMTLVRPQQATLASLVVVTKDPIEALSAATPQAFQELHEVIGDIEGALSALFSYDRINYLTLMMVDKDVHFHVIPRYRDDREFAGQRFTDPGWPKPPDLAHDCEATPETLEQLRTTIIGALGA